MSKTVSTFNDGPTRLVYGTMDGLDEASASANDVFFWIRSRFQAARILAARSSFEVQNIRSFGRAIFRDFESIGVFGQL